MHPMQRRQRGYSLIEVGLALAIATMALGYYARNAAFDAKVTLAQQQGDALYGLAQATNNYIAANYNTLITGGTVTGVATALAPQVSELAAQHYTTGTNVAANNKTLYATNYVVSLSLTPASCTTNSVRCDITGMVYISSAVPNADTVVTGAALEKMGGDGYRSVADAAHNNGGTLYSRNGTKTMPNPLGNTGGILAMAVGTAATGYNALLPRDGSRPMTGPLPLATVTTGSACTTATGLASTAAGNVQSCVANVWTSVGSSYWQDPVATYAILTGGLYPCNATTAWQTRTVRTPSVGSGPRAYTCNGTNWAAMDIDDNGNLTVAGTLTTSGTLNATGTTNLNGSTNLNVTATEGAACTGNGIAQNGAGLILSCQSGTWSRSMPQMRVVYHDVPSTSTFSISTANCATGETLISGGGTCAISNGSVNIPMLQSSPNANGWTVMCNSVWFGGTPVIAEAVAVCGK